MLPSVTEDGMLAGTKPIVEPDAPAPIGELEAIPAGFDSATLKLREVVMRVAVASVRSTVASRRALLPVETLFTAYIVPLCITSPWVLSSAPCGRPICVGVPSTGLRRNRRPVLPSSCTAYRLVPLAARERMLLASAL